MAKVMYPLIHGKVKSNKNLLLGVSTIRFNFFVRFNLDKQTVVPYTFANRDAGYPKRSGCSCGTSVLR